MFKQESWPDFVYTPEPKPELAGFESEAWKENNSVDKDTSIDWFKGWKPGLPFVSLGSFEASGEDNNTTTSGLKKVAPTEYLSDDGSGGPCE
jgi:hypothetical protein